MLKRTAAVVIIAALAASAVAAPVTDWKQISKTLDTIPTGAGISLAKRLKNCKVTIHKDQSWMETRAVAWPDYAAKPGDTVLKLVMDMAPPPPPASGFKQALQQKNVTAYWVISQGKATPLSSWAQALQNRPVPLGYDASNNC
jgi:hypothetical protein